MLISLLISDDLYRFVSAIKAIYGPNFHGYGTERQSTFTERKTLKTSSTTISLAWTNYLHPTASYLCQPCCQCWTNTKSRKLHSKGKGNKASGADKSSSSPMTLKTNQPQELQSQVHSLITHIWDEDDIPEAHHYYNFDHVQGSRQFRQ